MLTLTIPSRSFSAAGAASLGLVSIDGGITCIKRMTGQAVRLLSVARNGQPVRDEGQGRLSAVAFDDHVRLYLLKDVATIQPRTHAPQKDSLLAYLVRPMVAIGDDCPADSSQPIHQLSVGVGDAHSDIAVVVPPLLDVSLSIDYGGQIGGLCRWQGSNPVGWLRAFVARDQGHRVADVLASPGPGKRANRCLQPAAALTDSSRCVRWLLQAPILTALSVAFEVFRDSCSVSFAWLCDVLLASTGTQRRCHTNDCTTHLRMVT